MASPWRLYFYGAPQDLARGTLANPNILVTNTGDLLYKSPILLPVTLGEVKITRDQGTRTYQTLSGGTVSVRGSFSQPSFEFPDLFYDDMQEMEFFLNMCSISNRVLLLYHDSTDPWDPLRKVSYPVVCEKFPEYQMVSTPDQLTKPRYRVKTPKFVAVTNKQFLRGTVAT